MKKGFTLVELLAILAVLGIMVILVVPQLSGSINNNKEKELEKIIEIAENAGKVYHSFNEDIYKIPMDILKDEEYIDNLDDPITGNELDGCIRVLKDSDDLLKYEYSSCDGIDVSLIVNLNGGSTTQRFQSTYYDGTKINLVDPTKANHNFERWELVKGNSILNGKTLVMGTTETTIYALWSRWPKLTVNLNGGSTSQTFDDYYKTGTNITLVNPTRVGYTFTGWSVSSGVLSGNNLTMGTNDITLTANWQINTYQISYELNGGTKGTNAPTNGTYGSTVTVSNPTRVGYTFNGWAVTGAGATIDGTNLKIGHEDITLTANWQANTYTISYVMNGGTKGTNAPTSGTYGSTVTVSNPTRTGYTFNGWSVSGTGASISGTSLKIGSSNITLTANWEANTYTVTTYYYYLYQNTTWQHFDTRTDSVKYGESFTPYYVTTPTGYYQDSVYNYWDSSHTTELGNGTTGVTPFTVTDNRIVHVHYRPNTYTISYNLNGGSYGASAPTSGIYATTVTVSNPTRVGYTFNGWSVSGTGAVLSGTNLTIGSSNITLTAKWTANTYTVVTNYYRYYQNTTWQQFSTKTDYIKYGQTYTPSYTTTPTGYYRVSTYSIWNSSNSTQIGSGTVGSTPITITDNIVVHVDYKPNTYTITYNLGGGTKGSSAPSSGVYGTTVTVSNPTRSGYTFTGWSVSGTGAVLSGTNLTIGSSNITLIANWKVNEVYLYRNGDQNTAITGGWILNHTWGYGYSYDGTLSFNTNYMQVTIPGHGSDFLRCVNKINLTPYSKLSITYTKTGGDSSDCTTCATQNFVEDEWWLANNLIPVYVGSSTSGTIVADISGLVGEYYVGFGMTADYVLNSATFTVTEIKLS